MRTVDRIDDKGHIREHVLTLERNRTRCGLVVYQGQKPAGNAKCRRCLVLAAKDALLALRDAEKPTDC